MHRRTCVGFYRSLEQGDARAFRELWDEFAGGSDTSMSVSVIKHILWSLTWRRPSTRPADSSRRVHVVLDGHDRSSSDRDHGRLSPEDYAAFVGAVVTMMHARRSTNVHVIPGDVPVEWAAECDMVLFEAARARHIALHGNDPLACAAVRWQCLLSAALHGATDVFDALCACPLTWTLLEWDVAAWRKLLATASEREVNVAIVCRVLDRLYTTGGESSRRIAGIACYAGPVMAAVAYTGHHNLLLEMLALVTPDVERDVAAMGSHDDTQPPSLTLLCAACRSLSVTMVTTVLDRFQYNLRQLRQAYVCTCNAVPTAPSGAAVDPADAAIKVLDALLAYRVRVVPVVPLSGDDLPEAEETCPLQAALKPSNVNIRLVQYLASALSRVDGDGDGDKAWGFSAPDWSAVLNSLLCCRHHSSACLEVIVPAIAAHRVVFSEGLFSGVGAFVDARPALALLATQPHGEVRDRRAAAMASGALRQMHFPMLTALRRETGAEPTAEDWQTACRTEPEQYCREGLPLASAVRAKCGWAIHKLLDAGYYLGRVDGTFTSVYEALCCLDNSPSSCAADPLDGDFESAIVRLRSAMCVDPATAGRLFCTARGRGDLPFAQWLYSQFLAGQEIADNKPSTV